MDSKKGNNLKIYIFSLIFSVASIIGMILLFNDSYFIITKRVAKGEIIEINRLIKEKAILYDFKVRYYNEYLHQYGEGEVRNIKRSFGKDISKGESVKILYSKLYLEDIYLNKYPHPWVGNVILDLIIVIFFSISVYIILKNRR